MITNKQNHNVIDYDYDYICLKHPQKKKQSPSAWFHVNIFSANKRYE